MEYIRPGYGGAGDYYNLDTIPPILSHLNWQRENFRDQFRHLCFVFLWPRFAIKYILRRAPDFFDWGSGVIDFPTDKILLEQESQDIILDGYFSNYLSWTTEQRTVRIIEIEELLSQPFLPKDSKVSLLFEQGNIFHLDQRYKEAIASYYHAVEIKPDYHEAWNNRGVALDNLGHYEEAIASYDQALEIKPDYHEAWNNRGGTLDNLGRYEEAIAAFDRALKIKPDYHEAWNNRGIALIKLGRNEEAIAAFDHAVGIKPDKHEAWSNRGVALVNLSRYEEAIASYDRALAIKSDLNEAWYNRGNALLKLD